MYKLKKIESEFRDDEKNVDVYRVGDEVVIDIGINSRDKDDELFLEIRKDKKGCSCCLYNGRILVKEFINNEDDILV